MPRRSFLLALVAAALAACGGADDGNADAGDGGSGSSTADGGTTTSPGGGDAGSLQPVAHSYQRITPSVDDAAVAAVVAADRRLAGELYRLLVAGGGGNFIYSPYSIATAFSMAEAGAENETERQMREALGIETPDAEWHAARNGLDLTIGTPIEVPEGASALELEIANAPFGQADFAFVDEFIRVLAEHYGADLTTVDFRANPDGARQLINQWVADQTADRITDLLPAGSIDAMVRLVLVNTVFFKAEWLDQFDPERTEPAPFTTADGSQVEVEMMNGSSRTTYGQGDGWQMTRLPYWGGYSMTLILPDQGRFDEVSERLGSGLFDEISAIRNDHGVTVAVPKFDFATPTDLVPLFTSLGMIEPFDRENADFSGMTTADELYISGAFHQATIEVDEFGTTATAATALVMSATSAPPPAEFRADRPFVFVIEHDATGEPLFVGQVLDPTA